MAISIQTTTLRHLIIFIFMFFSFSHCSVVYMREDISGVMFFSMYLFYIFSYLVCINVSATSWHQPPDPATLPLYTNFMPLVLKWVWPKASFLSKYHWSSMRPMVCVWPISRPWQYQKIEPHSQWQSRHKTSFSLLRRILSPIQEVLTVTGLLLCISTCIHDIHFCMWKDHQVIDSWLKCESLEAVKGQHYFHINSSDGGSCTKLLFSLWLLMLTYGGMNMCYHFTCIKNH